MAIYVSVVIVTTRKRFLVPVIQKKLGVTDTLCQAVGSTFVVLAQAWLLGLGLLKVTRYKTFKPLKSPLQLEVDPI